MEATRRVHSCFLFISFFLFIISTLCCIPFTVALQKKVTHQQRISLDYLGTPLINGEEYEAAILRAERDSANKVKRQQGKPKEMETTVEPTSYTQSDSPTDPVTLPPSSPSEVDNTTFTPTSSGSPPTSVSATTEQMSSSTTTTEATTSSTTTTTEEPPQIFPLGEGQRTKGYFCLCDYQVKVCDMNCCCDPDCSDEDKKNLFKRCDDDSRIYDPSTKRTKDGSCYKSYIMYTNNIPYRTERSSQNLLCVVKENVREAREFSRADMAKISRSISHGKINTRPKYTWDSLQDSERKITINYDEPYKYGSPIWSVRPDNENDERREVLFRLPAPLLTDTCSVLEPVKYLQDSESRCIRPLHDVISQCETLRQLNANHFISSILIIINPNKDAKWTETGGREPIIPVAWCSNSTHDCKSISPDFDSNFVLENVEEIEFPSPALGGAIWNTLHIGASQCTNVLSQLNLTFIHEGIRGITRILAKALLVDLPKGQKHVVQEFRTEFIWNNARKVGDGSSNDTNSTVMENWIHNMKLPRSGNPGYVVGKPLILGRKVITEMPKNDSDGKSKFAMHVLPDLSKWLLIQSAGDCPLTEKQILEYPRHPIAFGYEHVSSCKLPLKNFRYCEDLQKHIASVIFGYYGEISPSQFTKSSLYVAAYGSPDAFPSDWVQLKFIEMSTLTQQGPSSTSASNSVLGGCTEIVTSVHITVSYAYVGPVDSPQAKITGIFYEQEQPISIPDATEANRVKDIAVTTTVSFLDVTGKPTTRVATFPVVSVKLPKDFFYPFSSSTSGPSSDGHKIHMSYYRLLTSSLTVFLMYFGTFIL